MEPESSQDEKSNNNADIINKTTEMTPMKRTRRFLDPIIELSEDICLLRD